MRKNTQSGADAAADESYESFGGAQIERMASGASKAPREAAHLGLERPLIAPSWMKRLSTRGKLSRALVVALALLVALLVVLPRSTITLPPGIARLLTPAPTQTPQPGHFTVGQWEQVSGPPVQTTDYYDLLASPVDPLTAYTCTLPVPSDPTSLYSARPATVWVTHDAGVRWGEASLPPISGTGCEASPAQDGSHRVTLSVTDDTRDQNAQACGHSQYYLSEDDGATWRRIGPIVAEKTLGAEPVGVLVTESNLGGGPRACHCLFAFSFTPTGGASMGRLFMSHDATHSHWSPLPSLPVEGATAVRSGVYTILGITVDGKLLALGAEPNQGIVATSDRDGRLVGPPPRLWAWDTWTGRWDLAESRVPCQDLQNCALYATGAAAVFGAADAPQGTQFWLTEAARGGGSQPTQTFYRLFIPAD